jgi:Fe-S-cluster containining protein
MDLEISVREITEELRKQYVDCAKCPPYRLCCKFNDHYVLQLSEELARRVFGDSLIERLVEEKKLEPVIREIKDADGLPKLGVIGYYLEDTCPLLTKRNMCPIHDKQEELGLHTCKDYPFTFNDGKYGLQLYVDLHCFGIEQNWDHIKPFMETLLATPGLELHIDYFDGTENKVEYYVLFRHKFPGTEIPNQERT